MSSKPAAASALPDSAEPFPYAEVSPDVQSAPGAQTEQIAFELEDAKLAARQEGRTQAEAAFVERLARERDLVTGVVREFSSARQRYFERVELEVVQLALSIARRILHREAQIDPLLLAGMVRVVLEKMERGTKVVLRLNPEHASEWRAYFARLLDPEEVPEITDDSALEPSRCVIVTDMGSTELGLDVQLKEVERGLLDILAERPKGAP